MGNEKLILERVTKANLNLQVNIKAFERILKILYVLDCDDIIIRKTLKKYDKHLNPAEKIIAYRFATRCSGTERYNYGINSVLAVKKAQYKCIVCGEKDLRCLEIDHVNGRRKLKKGEIYKINEFQCLCANHHRIKTVMEKQQN